ncbi:unnamed protein product [Orchesella dallaii]|uniref:Uncharacterized protein n=1 Tax=Orchesella dallaii TaxID=48710 RepID=A0ABP1RWX3_9HEXA
MWSAVEAVIKNVCIIYLKISKKSTLHHDHHHHYHTGVGIPYRKSFYVYLLARAVNVYIYTRTNPPHKYMFASLPLHQKIRYSGYVIPFGIAIITELTTEKTAHTKIQSTPSGHVKCSQVSAEHHIRIHPSFLFHFLIHITSHHHPKY